MGTRADFYTGTGPDAEYLGSVHWDGYPGGFDWLERDFDRDAWSAAAAAEFASRDDSTTIWPWPWNNSATTDYAYTWTEDRGVLVSRFGGPWTKVTAEPPPSGYDVGHLDDQFPDMTGKRDPGPKGVHGPGAKVIGGIVLQ